ncbi:class I SAM-dependent methyltransferase [Micromonospora sp. WMMD956]|uniref:class I SAM-dependent methyltransferase n=1 Tax=Micromonospora TaxID=1873 RepID=UPI0024164B1F|nr:class I SAM-dependent methyltransferase [Micromonospora sp. WMMD956]MDG4817102.1 class I SAM-dependent methyltransferase [Micromonospora sp. WMMD956]
MSNAQGTPATGPKPPLRSMGDLNMVWEWQTPDEMQIQLAGTQPRDEYLQDRVDRAKWIAERLGITPESSIFEIGSGEGIMANVLAPSVRRMLCTDVSRSFLDKARVTCQDHANVDYHHIDNDYLAALPSAEFDAGFSLNVFIHLNVFEFFHYFRQIARILRPGGRFGVNFLDIGASTRSFFHFYAERYLTANPVEFKGFLSFHGVDVISSLAVEAGLTPLLDEFVNEDGVCYLILRRDQK